MGRNRNKDLEDNEQTIKELKAANRRLKSDNQRLKMELSTLQEAFAKTSIYLKGNTDGISVEKIIQGVQNGSNLSDIKKNSKCEKCGACSIKEFPVANVGRIILWSECKNRKVVKNGKEKEG